MSQSIPSLEKLRQSSSKSPSKRIPVKPALASDSETSDLSFVEPLETPVPTNRRSRRDNVKGNGSLREDQSTGGGVGTTREDGSIKREEKSGLKPKEGIEVSSTSVGNKIGKTSAAKSTGKDAESIAVGDVGKSEKRKSKGKSKGKKGCESQDDGAD